MLVVPPQVEGDERDGADRDHEEAGPATLASRRHRREDEETEGEEDGDITFTAEVEVRPQVRLTGYDELTVTIDPYRRAFICGATAFTQYTVP